MERDILTGELTRWLREESPALCRATLKRAPNMLPDEEDVAAFVELVVQHVDAERHVQVTAVRHWALTAIGQDARAASDWVTLLRVLKEEVGNQLVAQYNPQQALRFWRDLDDLLTYALIEATHLATDMDRARMLEHMDKLSRQMERVERTKTDFIAVAAHELRTPLTILEGYANMLRVETEPGSRLRVYVDGLENGTQRMQEVIADMIDVSLIDLQSIGLNYQQFYLEKVLLTVADNMDKHFRERNVELIVMPLPVKRLRVFGDPALLMKAFTKVLFNALKYTPDNGEVRLSGEVVRENEATDDLAGYMDVRIQDMGIGISADNLETIFEKFTSGSDVSLHSSGKTKFKGGGPGLGLPIAKGIIEAHGGYIWAESPGHDEDTCPGSTFHIELPIWLSQPEVIVGGE